MCRSTGDDVKESAKEAWDALKTMRIGIDRVRKANAQKLRKEYEGIAFRDGELVDDFALRLTGLINQLAILGDPEPSNKVVKKYLHVVPFRFSQIAFSIETLLDISTLYVEEVTRRLKAAEDRFEPAPLPLMERNCSSPKRSGLPG